MIGIPASAVTHMLHSTQHRGDTQHLIIAQFNPE